ALEIVSAIAIPGLLIAIALCIRRATPQEARTAVSGNGAAAETGPITRRSAFWSMHYWTIAMPLTLAIMVQVGFVVHQVSFLFPVLGREGAAFAVFLTALMAATSRIILDYRFRESCHKRGIHLSFQAPMCAGALRTKDCRR